ncbi:MAG: hypothetical protein R2810_04135 [Flavobacteriales bacterium]
METMVVGSIGIPQLHHHPIDNGIRTGHIEHAGKHRLATTSTNVGESKTVYGSDGYVAYNASFILARTERAFEPGLSCPRPRCSERPTITGAMMDDVVRILIDDVGDVRDADLGIGQGQVMDCTGAWALSLTMLNRIDKLMTFVPPNELTRLSRSSRSARGSPRSDGKDR